MRKLSSFWFGFLLAFSLMFCCWSFSTAAQWRAININDCGVGGEIFSLLAPAGVIFWRGKSI